MISLFYYFSGLKFFTLLHFGEDLRLVFIQTGDHKIAAHKFWLSIAGNIEKEVAKEKKGVSIWLSTEGFWENFHKSLGGGTRYSESRSPYNKEERDPISRHSVTSLGTVPKKSWDRAVWGQSWDSAILGQCWTRTVLIQSWDSGLGTVVWGQWSWDSGLGTVVLGQWSWDSGLGTVVLGQWFRDSGLGIVVLGQWSWDKGLGTRVLGQWSWDSGPGTRVLGQGLGTRVLGQWSWDSSLGTLTLGQ